jgi:hypothetical protein
MFKNQFKSFKKELKSILSPISLFEPIATIAERKIEFYCIKDKRTKCLFKNDLAFLNNLFHILEANKILFSSISKKPKYRLLRN